MKYLFVPIAIFLALITFFVIIDRKEFYSYDDVKTVQSEIPTPTKPLVTVPEVKPADTNPAETKQAIKTNLAEVKPVETSPVAETKSVAETNSDSSAETKPATEAKPEETAKPAAVPVVTAEDMEKLNLEALVWFESEVMRREPFYPLYKGIKLNTAFMEGTVRDVSIIPDPQKNDYPDCLYSLMIEVNSFLFPQSPNKTISQELIINVPIMKDEEILEDNLYKTGDKFTLTCAAYDDMPDKVKEIQVSDDYQSFEHDYYYVLTIDKIKDFSNAGKKLFSKRQITFLPVKTLEKDEIASQKRAERIQNEICRIEDELSKHGGTFAKWKEEYKPIGDKYKELVKEKFECWIRDSFFSACGNETEYNSPKQYIEGILPYKKYLEENNIDLLLVRIPSKGYLY